MTRWSHSAARFRHQGLPTAAILAVALAGTLAASGAPPQVPAPYGLFVLNDCEVKSEYSAETRSTIAQLALTPPGANNTPSAASLVLRVEYPGRRPEGLPSEVTVLAVPAVTSNPNTIRNFELEFTVERAGSRPLRLFYFGRSWGDYGFVPAGGEITRVGFSMSAADLQVLIMAERVTGRVMSSSFALTGRQLAALRLFALTVGVPDPDTRLLDR